MSRARRHFTDEFKREDVRPCREPGAPGAEIAQEKVSSGKAMEASSILLEAGSL